MILSAQRKAVERLSALAAQRSQVASQRRAAYERWKQKTFGSLDSLAWMFAAGAIWAAVRNTGSDRSRTKRLVMGAANLGLLGWRFLNRADNELQQSAATSSVDARVVSQN